MLPEMKTVGNYVVNWVLVARVKHLLCYILTISTDSVHSTLTDLQVALKELSHGCLVCYRKCSNIKEVIIPQTIHQICIHASFVVCLLLLRLS